MYKRWYLFIGSFLLLFIFTGVSKTEAATKYWNGTAGGAFNTATNWSIYSGSGSSTSVPGSGDTIIFDSGKTTNANITVSMTGASIEIRAGYTGTVTLSSAVTVVLNKLTIGSSSATVLMGANSKLNLKGSGTPLTGSGTLNTSTNTPNTVEYTGPGTTNVTAGGPLSSYYHLIIDPPGFGRNSSLSLNNGETLVRSGVINTVNGYAYFGTFATTPNVIVKVRLSDFTRVGILSTTTPGDALVSAAIDTANGFAYFGTRYSAPGIITKVRLSDFTVASTLTLNTGENIVYGMDIDTTNGFLYPLIDASPNILVKVRLSDFTRIGALTLNTGENGGTDIVTDPANGYVYVVSATTPPKVIKVQGSSLTRIGALTLTGATFPFNGTIIDRTNGYIYVGTQDTPAKVVKVRLSDFTNIGSITFHTGEDSVGSATIDTTNANAYFGMTTTPGIIVKVRLSDFSRVGAVTLPTGHNSVLTALTDPTNGFGYFADFISTSVPSTVFRLNFGSTALNLGTAASQTLTVNGNFTIGDGTNRAPVTGATFNPTVSVAGLLEPVQDLRSNRAIKARQTMFRLEHRDRSQFFQRR